MGNVKTILYLADLLEMCQFKTFWKETNKEAELVNSVAGFEDSVRKFVCHVISVSYQTIWSPPCRSCSVSSTRTPLRFGQTSTVGSWAQTAWSTSPARRTLSSPGTSRRRSTWNPWRASWPPVHKPNNISRISQNIFRGFTVANQMLLATQIYRLFIFSIQKKTCCF